MTAQEPFPQGFRPMLATAGPLPTGAGWVHELKWDGVRALLAIDDTTLRITSRNGNDLTGTFPELSGLATAIDGHAVLLDGEIVAFDAMGRPAFNRIQERLGVRGPDALLRARSNPVVVVLFDVLHVDGFSTRSLSLRDRRRLLEQLDLGDATNWRISDQHDDGVGLLDATRAADLEGVVSKRLDAPYLPGARTTGWIKVKNLTIDEFVIGGWVPGEGAGARSIGALLLGATQHDGPDAPLRFIGRAGTGFSMAEIHRLYALLAPDRTTTTPFVNDPGEPRSHYVTSRHRCRVEYREWTPQGILRFPSYKGVVTSLVAGPVTHPVIEPNQGDD